MQHLHTGTTAVVISSVGAITQGHGHFWGWPEQQTLSRCCCGTLNSSRRAWRQAEGSLHGLKRSTLSLLAMEGTHLMLPTLHQGCAHNRARDSGSPRPIAPSAPLTGCAVGQPGSSLLQTVAGTLHVSEYVLNIRVLTLQDMLTHNIVLNISILTAAAGAL